MIMVNKIVVTQKSCQIFYYAKTMSANLKLYRHDREYIFVPLADIQIVYVMAYIQHENKMSWHNDSFGRMT